MTEPETQTEDETREVTTDTENVTSDDQISIKYKTTDYENKTNEDTRKDRFWVDKEWAREMKSYAELQPNAEKKDERKTTSKIARLPGAEVVERALSLRECFPVGGFQLEHRTRTTVGRSGRTRIWRSMRMRQPVRNGKTRILRRISENGSRRLWPCLTRDAVIGLEAWEKEGRKRRRDVFPCDPTDDDESFLREQRNDFAVAKELGHVRVSCSEPKKLKLLVDRAVGERPGLVNGDYIVVELPSKRVYTCAILHGMKGMDIVDTGSLRERRNTWKFCFYQAIVALLAKTQLRYKYAWSANIDYIYDHAWMLFTHIGTINVKAKQRLDDIVVYNYKYSVEIELFDEVKDEGSYFSFLHCEVDLKKQREPLSRKDPLQVRVELGCQKVTDLGYVTVHYETQKLEEWLGKLIPRCRDCILRTFRFSLAFWRDGLFWYLYNPYQCDKYGFWDHEIYGRACIMKFCSSDSLRRHLMILLLRSHANTLEKSRLDDHSDINDPKIDFNVQIFDVSFRCCQLDNPRLLQRDASKQPRRADQRPSDLFEIEDRDDETDREEDKESDLGQPRERVIWLRRCRAMTWGKCAPVNRKRLSLAEVTATGKARWHQYYVEEPNRLFSLWGEIHITDDMFDEANRGMQAYACYVVCAGMTRIMAPEYWTPKILDAIVVCGDRYYTRSKQEAELKSVSDEDTTSTNHSFKYLSDRFDIGEILFEARMLSAVRGRLYAESSECLWRTLERVFSSYHFAVLTCESACLGLFKFCGAYYMCDVNSFGPPFFRYGHGAAYLLRATSFPKFIMVLVLIVGSSERSQFSLNPIEILRIVEVDTAFESRAKTRQRKHRFEKFVKKMPGKLPRFAFDGQKKRTKK